MEHSSAGDPDGRRLARQRAAKLSEAARVLRVAEILLEDAGVAAPALTTVSKFVAEQEQAQLQRSLGRIEPRSRFKYKSGHPLHEGRKLSQVFVDECGIPSPQPGVENGTFALGAVAFQDEAIAEYCQRADKLKLEFFDTTAITFHEPAMRNFDGAYYFGGDREKQLRFDAAVSRLVDATPFVVFGAGVRKNAFHDLFVATGLDPYLPADVYSLAITLLLERYVDFMAMVNVGRMGRVTLESQGPKEDALHQLEYARLLLGGTQWVPPSAFQQTIEPGARFVPKSGSHPTELADMFARDLFEWVRQGCTGDPKRWSRFSPKIYGRGNRSMGTFGVKVFPDSDIREQVERHRMVSGN